MEMSILFVALAFVMQVNAGNKDNGRYMFGADGHDEMAYDITHNITGVCQDKYIYILGIARGYILCVNVNIGTKSIIL